MNGISFLRRFLSQLGVEHADFDNRTIINTVEPLKAYNDGQLKELQALKKRFLLPSFILTIVISQRLMLYCSLAMMLIVSNMTPHGERMRPRRVPKPKTRHVAHG